MSEPTAPTAGAPACDAATLFQHAFFQWYYRPDGTPNTREQRLAVLRAGVAQRAAVLGESTVVSVEDIDSALMNYWHNSGGTPTQAAQA
jgi:hypothetical protein